MDRLSLFFGLVSVFSLVMGLYQLSLSRTRAAFFFLCCFLGLIIVFVRYEDLPEVATHREQPSTFAPTVSGPATTSPPTSKKPALTLEAVYAARSANPALTLEAVNAASAAHHLDPDLVNIMINDEMESGAQPVSAEVVAQSIRELLERYDFDLVKALAAYRAGGDRVEQYGGVPPDAKPYVSRIVHQYNIKIQQKRARTSAGR